MIIIVASDLHLEFQNIDYKIFFPHNQPEEETILILAGDITNIERSFYLLDNLIEKISSYYNKIYYIPGNHEFYFSEYNSVLKHLELLEKKHPEKFKILDNSFDILHDNIVFLGTTLWTDFNKEDPLTLFNSTNLLNDYSLITYNKNLFTPYKALQLFKKNVNFLKKKLKEFQNNKIVIITHHAPSFLSKDPKFHKNFIMNGNFYSNLEWLIKKNPQISLWVHGHSHYPVDYKLFNTRIICNPRGYPSENTFYNFLPKSIHI